MPRKKTYITATDQFCGAGGSSTGAKRAGVEVRLALNHWKLAIETHNTNHPDTDHDCTDIQACDPRRYPSTDILITSPECTNHSLAKGSRQVKSQLDLFSKNIIDPTAERSRATMWDVPRFAEYHNYNIIIVENVVDARKWVMFPAWLSAMHLLGYSHKIVYANSMHFQPTPQSRDRMYIVFWKNGNQEPDLNLCPEAYCENCCKKVVTYQWWKNPNKKWGKYKTQYMYRCTTCTEIVEPYYYAAFNAIDWADIGIKIGERKKPLSKNTIRRINHGLEKYGNQYLQVINYSPGYSKPINQPFSTITTTDHHGLLSPMVIKLEHSKNENVKPVTDVFQTQTTRQSYSLLTPWIIEMNRTGSAKPGLCAASTITAGGINHAMMAAPFIVENKGQSNSKSIIDVVGTQTTKPSLGVVSNEKWNSFIQSYYGNTTLNHITEPTGTVTTKERHSLVSYQSPKIEECYYRMLKPHEIQKIMAFDDSYIILGNSKDKVKQLGNAVTPPVMEWLVERCVQSLN